MRGASTIYKRRKTGHLSRIHKTRVHKESVRYRLANRPAYVLLHGGPVRKMGLPIEKHTVKKRK